MAYNSLSSRIMIHALSATGASGQFTVAPSNDPTDGTWVPSDLADREFGLNVTESRLYVRGGSAINEVMLIGGTGSVPSSLIGNPNVSIFGTAVNITAAASDINLTSAVNMYFQAFGSTAGYGFISMGASQSIEIGAGAPSIPTPVVRIGQVSVTQVNVVGATVSIESPTIELIGGIVFKYRHVTGPTGTFGISDYTVSFSSSGATAFLYNGPGLTAGKINVVKSLGISMTVLGSTSGTVFLNGSTGPHFLSTDEAIMCQYTGTAWGIISQF